MSGVFQQFKGLSAGQALDMVQRKAWLRRWRRRDRITVHYGNKRETIQSRQGTTDADVIWQCFVEKQYEVPRVPNVEALHYDAVQEGYSSIMSSGRKPLVIDCGANMGASVRWFDMRFPGSSIVAVEPAAANVALLRENCQARSNIQVLDAGVGGADEDAFLQDHGGGHWGYQTGKTQTDKPIKIISLASLIKASLSDEIVPFILKIDVEGAEKQLFNEPLDLIAAFPVIIFEPHDFYMPGARTASPFFKFHADAGRDFSFGYENVFSIDMAALDALAGK